MHRIIYNSKANERGRARVIRTGLVYIYKSLAHFSYSTSFDPEHAASTLRHAGATRWPRGQRARSL